MPIPYRLRTLILLAFAVSTSVARAQAPATQPASGIADAYRRATFVLNLLPAQWDQVRADAATIAAALRPAESVTADALMATIDHIIAARAKPVPLPDPDVPNADPDDIDALPPREAARQAFEQLTRATGALLQQRITALAGSAPASTRALADARDAFAAFEPTLLVVDPKALAAMQHDWNELENRLAAPASQSAADRRNEIIRLSSRISEYIVANFGPGFTAPLTGPLIAFPAASLTALRNARMPVALPPGSRIDRPVPRPRQILHSVQLGAAERDTPLSSLGAAAFNNPYLFGEPARSLGISCNTCHNKSGINPGFFIPGLSRRPGGVDVSNSFFAPHANNAVFDPLDIPDLRGIRFTAPYGRNGRFASLRDFTRNVIVNEFNGDEPDPLLLDAMVAYMNEFDFLPNPALNRDGTLNERASPEARRGEALFNKPFPRMDHKSCAACHIPSANFLDHQRHDIGSLMGASDFSRDAALDTPTLIGVTNTAPYFHDGSQPSLRAVVEWFNDHFKLNLSQTEIADLTAYVATVGNGQQPFQPADGFQSRDIFLAEDLEDQDSFLAAFESLEAKNKWNLIADLFRGVASELRREIADLHQKSHVPILTQMADLLDSAADDADAAAHNPNRRDQARAKLKQWRELYRLKKYDLR